METQFTDRILTCSDCHSEFIFTAGEQLFFSDKQFKNDPKRCKPCKSRRSGLSAAAAGATGAVTGLAAAGLSRTETRTECSDCGVETTVPFKPTQGRPVLCRQCFQNKTRMVAAQAAIAPQTTVFAPEPVFTPGEPVLQMTQAQAASALASLSANADGVALSADAAVMAVASMAAASSESTVATAADLASIAGLPDERETMTSTQIPQAVIDGTAPPPRAVPIFLVEPADA